MSYCVILFIIHMTLKISVNHTVITTYGRIEMVTYQDSHKFTWMSAHFTQNTGGIRCAFLVAKRLLKAPDHKSYIVVTCL